MGCTTLQGFDDEALAALVTHSKTLKAIVLLAYGTGNSPNKREGFLNFVREAARRRIVIVCITQCTQVNKHCYTWHSLSSIAGSIITTAVIALIVSQHLFVSTSKLGY
jgi:L-asparaginase/Glu-tRNA(Gln) amidotransferase subunit D